MSNGTRVVREGYVVIFGGRKFGRSNGAGLASTVHALGDRVRVAAAFGGRAVRVTDTDGTGEEVWEELRAEPAASAPAPAPTAEVIDDEDISGADGKLLCGVDGFVRIAWADEHPVPRSGRRSPMEAFLAALAERGPLTAAEVGSYARRGIREAEKAGRARIGPDYKWVITTEGT